MAGHWRFDWRLLLFSGLLLPLLVGLGIWQLNRAHQKEALLAAWKEPANDRAWAEVANSPGKVGQPVTVTGRYVGPSWLLDNRTRDGRAGYEVLTLFQPESGPVVLINRGWLAAPRSRDRLPGFSTPEGRLTLSGRLDDYPEPPVLAQTPAPESGWPRRVQALPRKAVARQVAAPAPMAVQLADSDQPGAFRADRQPDIMGPGTHYGYAAQWFAMAVALTILTLVASYRRTGADNDNDNG